MDTRFRIVTSNGRTLYVEAQTATDARRYVLQRKDARLPNGERVLAIGEKIASVTAFADAQGKEGIWQ